MHINTSERGFYSMKKRLALLLLSTSLLLSSCETSTEMPATPTTETNVVIPADQAEREISSEEISASDNVESEKELVTVEVSLPANIDDITDDEIEILKTEDGYISITRNEDQSVTYVITEEKQKELLAKLEAEFSSFAESTPGSEDYPNITKLEVNDDFSQFIITTTASSQEELSVNETALAAVLYAFGGTYRGYACENDTSVTVEYICDSSGELIGSGNSINVEIAAKTEKSTETENVAKSDENATTETNRETVSTNDTVAPSVEASTASSTDTVSPEVQTGTTPSTTETASPGNGNGNNFNTYDNKEQQQTSASYVLNTNTMKIHYPSCSSVAKIAPQNYSTSNQSVDELQNQGYSTCGRCFK